MSAITIIIALFFYFLFKWAFRALFLILVVKVLASLKDVGQAKMKEFEEQLKGEKENV